MADVEERFEEVYDELRDELEELCHEKRYNDLRKRLVDMNPADIAWLLDDMPEDHLPIIFRLLSKEVAADVFINLESDSQEMLIKSFSNAELEAILDEMFLDDTIDVIEEMPANVVKRILKYSDPETRREINKILQYPEDSAGSLMTTEFIRLRRGTTVAGAFDVIRKKGDDSETINVSYVTDEERHLIGYVTIRTLVLEKDPYALIGLNEDEKKSNSAFEFRPLGCGVQNVPELLKAAEAAGSQWIIIEQDQPSMGKSPMECVAMSMEYMKKVKENKNCAHDHSEEGCDHKH